MIDERSLRAAAAALEKDWIQLATEKELDLLAASGDAPHLFEDDGSITIVLGFDAFGDGRRLTVSPPEQEREVAEKALDLVWRRTRLRARLRLPANDCGARKANPACVCLTSVLDELGENADRETIVAAARKRHKRKPRSWNTGRLLRDSASESPVENARAPFTEPPPRLSAPPPRVVTETPTRRRWRPRFREPEPINPIAWYSQKSRRRRSLIDQEF